MLALAFVPLTWVPQHCASNNLVCARAPPPSVRITTKTVMSAAAEEEAKQAWLQKNEPAWSQSNSMGATRAATQTHGALIPAFVREPLSYFALDQLTAKGSRSSQGSLVDVGEPHDSTRPLAINGEGVAVKWNNAGVGSWACTPGGWDSPKLRPTTETFLVLDGWGSVADADGMVHTFGAGDVVVLPKHWSGRWDITEQIHKLWVVHDHPDVVGAADGVVRAVVASLPSFAPEAPAMPIVERTLAEAPAHVAQTVYDVGPTRVGFLTCSPGSFVVAERTAAEVFFVVDGVFFLTNFDGSSRRCTAGDTVVLPKGWAGLWDIIDPVQKVWVEVN